MPLPSLGDDACRRIPAGMRSNVYGAAYRIDLRRGRLAQIQPGAYPCAATAPGASTSTAGPGSGVRAVLGNRVTPSACSAGSSPRPVSAPSRPPFAEASVACADAV
ncbi:hypothetical protein OHS71_00400 [Streptomyces sp. NBC_00377]|uniref:hypothetical protein n=1 Tax=unclassified Streptomyces TaxID=2593676 RepID=UPI002E22BA78|nr:MULTISPECIES: hypothetical protein [unclassified Streptomyces]